MSVYENLTRKQYVLCLSMAIIGAWGSILSLVLIAMYVVTDFGWALCAYFAPVVIGAIGCHCTALYFTKKDQGGEI